MFKSLEILLTNRIISDLELTMIFALFPKNYETENVLYKMTIHNWIIAISEQLKLRSFGKIAYSKSYILSITNQVWRCSYRKSTQTFLIRNNKIIYLKFSGEEEENESLWKRGIMRKYCIITKITDIQCHFSQLSIIPYFNHRYLRLNKTTIIIRK